ncbi:16S rRNA (uracil(1498)-N(3))-methyltransferase [Legionella sp. km772]|uniref:16S rRNA (uracil(1498)-N(3))-methyltransferase n=1 Tax=Legionella sp. km772 TaxID=2498111 RepID=UPI000F8D5D2F|nr:16S rRNA (uracil(1498)-N(3))-methyltransferase [Legionella sp. km772]RUR12579.1 16S rRNA (uracil(1498)-N(3))-methyltransferase [Legionella sp. km772]
MREVRIYQAGDYEKGQVLELSPEAGQHVAVVLRMRVGEPLTLFNGMNVEFLCTITVIKKKQVFVSIDAAQEMSRESPLQLHLGQAISKGERMEWVMQKATELGVASITPLITERCAVKLDKERMMKKIQQWQSIVIAACEQCGRNKVPLVQPPVYLEQFLQTLTVDLKFILHTQNAKGWQNYQFNAAEIALIIGPEGGFSEMEIAQAEHYHCAPLSLGPRVLRTETAAISALSLLQAVGGDL